MRKCSRMPMRRASRCSKAVRAFPLERPSAWHAMRAEWWCSPHQALGARRPDEALESRDAMPTTPPRGARRGLSGRTTGEWRALLPAPGRAGPARGAGGGRSAGEPDRRATTTKRRGGAAHQRAHCSPRLAGRAPRRRLCDQRVAPARNLEPVSATRRRRSSAPQPVRGTAREPRRRARAAPPTAAPSPPPASSTCPCSGSCRRGTRRCHSHDS